VIARGQRTDAGDQDPGTGIIADAENTNAAGAGVEIGTGVIENEIAEVVAKTGEEIAAETAVAAGTEVVETEVAVVVTEVMIAGGRDLPEAEVPVQRMSLNLETRSLNLEQVLAGHLLIHQNQ